MSVLGRGRTGNPGRAALSERGADLYETPPEAVKALLKVEHPRNTIWEPCAGRGAITRVLLSRMYGVYATDLVDYGSEHVVPGVDFLMEREVSPYVKSIVMNPPYRLANEFVRHAINMVPTVYALLRLAFLEGVGRSDLIDGTLSRVWVFRNRLPRMHRDGWQGSRATSTIAFGWFVFEQTHTGPVQLSRITWEKEDGMGREEISGKRHRAKR